MRYASLIIILTIISLFFVSSLLSAKQGEGKIYFERGRDIWTINPDGTKETRLSNIGKFVSPVLSPNGKKIVFVSQPHSMMYGQGGLLGIANTDGSHPISVSGYNYADEPGARWFPDSKTFSYEKYIFNLKGEKIKEIPLPWSWDDTKLSSDGSEIACYAFESKEIIIRLSSIKGDNPEKIMSFTNTFPPRSGFIAESSFSGSIQWSPDGKKMLICELINKDGVSRVWWYIDLQTYKKSKIANLNNCGVCCWTPDGKKIVYRDKEGGIYLMKPDGTGNKKLLSQKSYTFGYWSPDGKKMLCRGGDYENPEIWIYEMETEKFYKIAEKAKPIGWIK